MVKKKSNIGWWILGLVLVFAIGILAGKYLINQDVLTSPGSGGNNQIQDMPGGSCGSGRCHVSCEDYSFYGSCETDWQGTDCQCVFDPPSDCGTARVGSCVAIAQQ